MSDTNNPKPVAGGAGILSTSIWLLIWFVVFTFIDFAHAIDQFGRKLLSINGVELSEAGRLVPVNTDTFLYDVAVFFRDYDTSLETTAIAIWTIFCVLGALFSYGAISARRAQTGQSNLDDFV